MLLTAFLYVRADHITGGQVYYTYTSLGNNKFLYHITVKLFMDCRSPRQFNSPATISIFNRANGQRVADITAYLSSDTQIELPNNNPCITDPPDVCYRVGTYEFPKELEGNAEGYVITAQINFRIYTLTNLSPGYGNVGATYTAEIPGTAQVADGPANNSAQFTGNDLVVVCAGNDMKYSFAATDPDGDQLRYSFCNAYMTTTGGGPGSGGSNVYPQPPPYNSVPYGNGFDAGTPLGNSVQIDINTGMITGIAPPSGVYVVTVCVEEIRNGKVIARQRKDLQIKITACTIAAASLPSAIMLCRNTFTIQLENRSQSPLIQTFYWEIKDDNDNILFQSTTKSPSYTFAAEGTYSVKLVVNRGDQCADSITVPAYVYPGMVPDFSASGFCVNKPTLFTNQSTTRFGAITSWDWDFGETQSSGASSQLRDPQHTYLFTGDKLVRLLVFNSNGCVDTAFQSITIINKPPIALAFRDTLICTPDIVQLLASGNGNFTWSPNQRINDPGTSNPVVNPVTTTKYYVDLNENGCVNRDSVMVRVVDHVSLSMMPDTTICLGDTIRLRLLSDGLQYSWSPGPNVLDPGSPGPRVTAPGNERYQVTARIGSCSAQGIVDVVSVPYPLVSAGADITVCYQAMGQLNGSTDGSRFSWSPAGSLINPGSLSPIARPSATTPFILTAWDDKGCPKPSFDTVLLTVLPKIIPYAGNDTNVVVGQPLQLKASGGVKYAWTPPIGLSDGNMHDPIAFYTTPSPGIRYKVKIYDIGNCVDSAFVTVKVFSTRPSVFVPNAFTPNGDGRNDVFRFVAAGIKHVEFFRVYNRWGQLVYSNPSPNPGWDGRVAGKLQDAGTYVWMIRAIDFNGGVVQEKGQMVLIR
ncbi:PKD domain-containing protein [Pseudoflavitalea rhizosphaerae]|uniref:PKD domain-containing protein n=1 Tax=Pseudoflavitalea rhizosphaerae TaxID=1884793 RepID=UPI000F8F4C8C|nr:PKD domain-containing protein [Pseudoflavitalea rhizosphaerae]